MIYNDLQKTVSGIDDNFIPIEVPVGEHIGKYDGFEPIQYNSMLMPSVRMNTLRAFRSKCVPSHSFRSPNLQGKHFLLNFFSRGK